MNQQFEIPVILVLWCLGSALFLFMFFRLSYRYLLPGFWNNKQIHQSKKWLFRIEAAFWTFFFLFFLYRFTQIEPLPIFIILTLLTLSMWKFWLNFWSWFLFRITQSVEIGDIISAGNYQGEVCTIDINGIKLLDENNNELLLSYSFLKKEVVKVHAHRAVYLFEMEISFEKTTALGGAQELLKLVEHNPWVNGKHVDIKQKGESWVVSVQLMNPEDESDLKNYIHQELDKLSQTK